MSNLFGPSNQSGGIGGVNQWNTGAPFTYGIEAIDDTDPTRIIYGIPSSGDYQQSDYTTMDQTKKIWFLICLRTQGDGSKVYLYSSDKRNPKYDVAWQDRFTIFP